MTEGNLLFENAGVPYTEALADRAGVHSSPMWKQILPRTCRGCFPQGAERSRGTEAVLPCMAAYGTPDHG